MSKTDIYRIALRVIETLEAMGIPYHLGGSLASMAHGVPRNTLDADIVAGLPVARIPEFIQKLGAEFLSNVDALKESFRKQRSNNLIHVETMLKIDLYPAKDDPFSRSEADRRVRKQMPGIPDREIWCCSAEDIVLRKLDWYRAGGLVARRQWEDAVQVLAVQAATIDKAYLEKWAERLNVSKLIQDALKEAGLNPTA